jgi:hypothetical protein
MAVNASTMGRMNAQISRKGIPSGQLLIQYVAFGLKKT